MKIKKFMSVLISFSVLFSLFNVGAFTLDDNALQSIEFEPKVFINATIDQEFCGRTVLLVMDKNVGGLDKEHCKSFFGDFPIERIRDLTPSLEVILERDPEFRQTIRDEEKILRNSQNEEIDMRTIPRDMSTFRQILAIDLPIDCKQNVLNVIAQLEKVDGIISAEPNYIIHYDEDSIFDANYENTIENTLNSGHPTTQWALTRIRARQAWNMGGFNTNIRVGVVGTGIANHPDLNANLNRSLGRDFIFGSNQASTPDERGGGTRQAGVIGAVWNNTNNGVAGIARNVTLVPFKVFHDVINNSSFENQDLINTVNHVNSNYADPATRIHILNISIGNYVENNTLRQVMRDYRGLIVAAAGSNTPAINNNIQFPARYNIPNIIAVGASTQNDMRRSNSNFGANTVHLFAPGESVRSTTLNSGYAEENGSSIATPHVAGVAALLMSAHPNATIAQIKAAILSGVDTVANRGLPSNSDLTNVSISRGRLNAQRALDILCLSLHETYHLRNAATGHYLDAWGATNGTIAIPLLAVKINDEYQRWILRYNGTSIFEIYSSFIENGNVLTITLNSPINPIAVLRAPENGIFIRRNSDGTVSFNRFGSVGPSNMYLTASGGNAVWAVGPQWNYNNPPNMPNTQKWHLER
jgi:hypothetical protein